MSPGETARIDRARVIAVVTLALVAILVLMTFAALLLLRLFADSTRALESKSRRDECRVAIVNMDTDRRWDQVANALDAIQDDDTERLESVLHAMLSAPSTQSRIQRYCPPALSEVPTVSSSGP